MVEPDEQDIAAAEAHFTTYYPNTAWGFEALTRLLARRRTEATAALTAERDALAARVAELEGALAPFAEQADARRNNLQGAICFPQSFLIAARKALHDPT